MARRSDMHGKKMCSLSSLPSNDENILVADENGEGSVHEDITLKRSMFLRLGLQKAHFRRSVLRHSIFQDCYCRAAKFEDVDFTGCHFKECNLHKASFVGCKLWYVRFTRCNLSYDEILSVVPSEPSIAIRLLRSLRQNAIEMGEGEYADRILRRQIEAEKKELGERFWARSTYYRDRFDRAERIWSGLSFLGLTAGGWLWGHGLQMWSIVRTGVILVLVFAMIFYRAGEFSFADNGTTPLSMWEAIYISVSTFATLGYGDFTPTGSITRLFCAIESLFGIVFLGFLAASVYRRLAR